MKQIEASVRVLSDDELQLIHRSSLRILERVGVRLPHSECLAACRRAGAQVDEASETVRFPGALMDNFLKEFRGQTVANLDDAHPKSLCGVISTQVHLIDYMAPSRRLGTVEDVRKGITLVQQLGNFPTANAVVVPSDIAAELSDVVSFQLIYSYSRKPGG